MGTGTGTGNEVVAAYVLAGELAAIAPVSSSRQGTTLGTWFRNRALRSRFVLALMLKEGQNRSSRLTLLNYPAIVGSPHR